MNDQDIFEHKGLRFRLHIEHDHDGHADAPWDREDGHGPVRYAARTRNKRPGERVLHCDGRGFWLYDWQAAAKAARRDGWGPGGVQEAVQADFDRLQGYLEDRWWYVGVCVTVESDPDSDKYEHALWGIESDCTGYIEEVARELAEQAGKAYLERIAKLEEGHAEAAQQSQDALRWRTLVQHIKTKELGTEFDPDTGRPTSPTFRRFFLDCHNLSLTTLNDVVDAL